MFNLYVAAAVLAPSLIVVAGAIVIWKSSFYLFVCLIYILSLFTNWTPPPPHQPDRRRFIYRQ